MKGHKELEVLVRILEPEKEVWKKIRSNDWRIIEDTYFNFPEIVLRIRNYDKGSDYDLAYKENVFKGGRWLYAKEYETMVGEEIYDILEKLGYKPTVKIEMTKYFCPNGIEIQKVKKLGLFMEVEGKNRKEIWERIKKTGIKVSEEFGIGKPDMMLKLKNNKKLRK